MSNENHPPVWPPVRRRVVRVVGSQTSQISSLASPTRHAHSLEGLNVSSITPTNSTHINNSPLSNAIKSPRKRPRYRNGYEVKPQTPSYKPYMLNSRGRKRQRAYAFEDEIHAIEPMEPLSPTEWNRLARENNILPLNAELREFQMQCANIAIGLAADVCVISPTGSGKSLLWLIPLLVQSKGISLVITPYTNLGIEGETKCVVQIFIYFEINTNISG